MNRGTAFKWIDRLESGKYKQGAFQLRRRIDHYSSFDYNKDEFCVFGVLADFLDSDGWKLDNIFNYNWHREVFFIKDEILWSKCKFKNKWSSPVIQELSEINDGNDQNFCQCINFIKQFYEVL